MKTHLPSSGPTVFLGLIGILLLSPPAQGAGLIDRWVADDLNATVDEGAPVNTWTSANSNNAVASGTDRPVLRKGATPAGTSVLRFSGNRMAVASSPVGGRSAFSVAIVFKATSVGAGDNVQWWGKSGLVDAEQPGVTADWGTVSDEGGHVGIGTGSSDNSTYSLNAPSVVDGNYHVAVFTWGGGSQAVYVDGLPGNSQSGVSTVPRNSAGCSFGSIHTGETNRRLNGDLAEIRFYDSALEAAEAAAVISELTDIHLFGNRPIIRQFRADRTDILIGDVVTLSWNVTNTTSLSIDQGVGSLGSLIGTVEVTPAASTTYTLLASNSETSRTAQVTVNVDPVRPNVFSQSVSTMRDAPVAITLTGLDPQGLPLTYTVVAPPGHGSLSGTPPALTYQPNPNYSGTDAFMFQAGNGAATSPEATVFINVVAPPEPPTAILLDATNVNVTARPGSFLGRLTSVDANPEDTHVYSLVSGAGDTDNALFSINGDELLAAVSFANAVGIHYQIRIRSEDSGGLSFEQSLALTGVDASAGLVLNEIHYNPSDNTIPEEFIELYNPAGAAVQLDGWRVSGGVDYFFPNGAAIPAAGFLLMAQSPATILSRYGVAALGPWAGQLANEGETVTLRDARDSTVDEVSYRSEFPWPIAADGEGGSMQLIHPALDNDLGSSWMALAKGAGSALVTPGATNGVYQANPAPNIRQVNHAPSQPTSSSQTVVTCKVTDPDGVGAVELHYQVVAPGAFLPSTLPLTAAQLNSLNANPSLDNDLNPAFEDPANWTTAAMHDDGLTGDAAAEDEIYSVVLPAQPNRTLVRYRITVTDSLGASRRAPFADDPSLNFAYFVYDGIPPYQGFSSEVLQSLPVYTLITRDADLNQCAAWFNTGDQLPQDLGGSRNEGRLHFNWEGAFVYEGKVYDHVTYRLRGANGRYHPGKRSFRFRFKKGRYFEARDIYGKRYPTLWREVTTGKGQSNRGSESFALNEVINLFLFNKVGVPAPSAHFFHFRVVREPEESPADPYAGDFWGLNWAQEKYDVNFLDAHDLPRGNLYKLVDNYVLGVDERRYQAPMGVTQAEDFYNIENNLTGFQSVDWLLAYANYPKWYRYFAIAEGIRHYDTWPSSNKNGAWYFEPVYSESNNHLGRLVQLPYDTTDTWGPTWNNGEDVLFNGIFPSSAPGGDSGQHPELQLEYRNVVREVRDLLFQPDQINAVIDAFAGVISDFAPADYARWRNAPAPASYGSLLIPNSPGVTGGLPAYVQDMKNFMFAGGNNAWWIDRQSVGAGGWVTRLDQVANDPDVPAQPVITYAGTPGFPLDELAFASSAFSDPQGNNTFAAMQWRVAEVMDPASTPDLNQLKLEWDAAWDSGELPAFTGQIDVPAFAVEAGRFYRARVRHKDNTGRWSHWSDPFTFVPSSADILGVLRQNLVLTEIMYNPPGAPGIDGDEFEFLELKNMGGTTLDLSGLFFSAGIDFNFPSGTTLAPGGLFLLARNPAVLQTRYPGLVADGDYSGKLDNGGETITLSHPHGVILSVTYNDKAPWPVTPDGFGFSLVLKQFTDDPNSPMSWRASSANGGSPRSDDPPPPASIAGVVINEILTASTLPAVDTIELFNPTAQAVALDGWYLTDDVSDPWKFRIPDNTTIQAGGFLVFDENQFNTGAPGSFLLSSLGEQVYLFSADAAGQLTGYSHGFSFGAAADGVSFGRYVISTGEEHFPAQKSLTPNGPNAGPLVGPVVISEIMYHPPDLVVDSQPVNDDVHEFVELLNLTDTPVAFFDSAHATNRWEVRGAVDYTFPEGFMLGAHGYVLVVGFDPGTNAVQLAEFRSYYGLDDGVPILGPFAGNLANGGENVELYAPLEPVPPPLPNAGVVPYVLVDRVTYEDDLPWPPAADGLGASLQRRDNAAYGDDPANWLAALPRPGADRDSGAPPVITVQPLSRSVPAGTNVVFSVTATGPNLHYQWQFNGANLTGATGPILSLGNVQPSSSGTYRALVFNAAGSDVSATAGLSVANPPVIISHPQSLTIQDGLSATLSVVASGLPPLRYQWFHDGVAVTGATNADLVFDNLQLADTGLYQVAVANTNGSTLSLPADLYVLVEPVVLIDPLSQGVVLGDDLTFSISVTGSLPLYYRWRKGSATLTNEVLNSGLSFYTLHNVQLSDVVPYTVVVSNAANFKPGILSARANLTILADADKDLIADVWETEHGLDPGDPNDAALDPDGDGRSNREEYVSGTDPNLADDVLHTAFHRASGADQAEFNFEAVSNKTYTLQYREAVDSGPWLKLEDFPATPTNRSINVQDSFSKGPQRYYRLVTPRQP
jgi:Lamin Tail Domain/CotH kinase protein/Bacterial Ig domain/Concanavalin A-like lectin/glucanases superfamily/Immunoglobulin domain